MNKIKSISVFCGSNFNGNEKVKMAIEHLSQVLVKEAITLVYGGGKVGIMGLLADSVLENEGRVIGVIPQFLLEKEVGHAGLSELHVVESMHERKQLMNDLSEGIMMLPGGVGTLEEFFEIFTWLQLGLIHKPLGILNIDGFYNLLLDQLEKMVQENYLKKANLNLILVSEDPGTLIHQMKAFQSKPESVWFK